jgi:hypothetical protein
MRARGFPTAFGSDPPQLSSGMQRSPGTNAPESQAKYISKHWPNACTGQSRSVFAQCQAGPRAIAKASELDSMSRRLNGHIQLREKILDGTSGERLCPPPADGLGGAIAIDRARQFILESEHRSANRSNTRPRQPVEYFNFAEVFPSCPLPSVLSF